MKTTIHNRTRIDFTEICVVYIIQQVTTIKYFFPLDFYLYVVLPCFYSTTLPPVPSPFVCLLYNGFESPLKNPMDESLE